MLRKRHKPLTGQRDRFRAVLQYELFNRHTDGELTDDELDEAMSASEHNRVIDEVVKEYERTGLEADWDSIIAWFKENWLSILQAILSAIMIFTEEDKDG